MVVSGKVSDLSLKPLYVNGMRGENTRNYHSGSKTYFQWVFTQALPTNISWDIKV